jgi:hypothetical protein
MARLYVFRPDFTEHLIEQRPTLLVNGNKRCLLAIGQFDTMLLPPGSHKVALEPGPGESALWRSEYLLTLAPDSVSFLAVWNRVESSLHEAWIVVPVAGLFVPQKMNYDHSTTLGVRYEQVAQDDALAALATMHRGVE